MNGCFDGNTVSTEGNISLYGYENGFTGKYEESEALNDSLEDDGSLENAVVSLNDSPGAHSQPNEEKLTTQLPEYPRRINDGSCDPLDPSKVRSSTPTSSVRNERLQDANADVQEVNKSPKTNALDSLDVTSLPRDSNSKLGQNISKSLGQVDPKSDTTIAKALEPKIAPTFGKKKPPFSSKMTSNRQEKQTCQDSGWEKVKEIAQNTQGHHSGVTKTCKRDKQNTQEHSVTSKNEEILKRKKEKGPQNATEIHKEVEHDDQAKAEVMKKEGELDQEKKEHAQRKQDSGQRKEGQKKKDCEKKKQENDQKNQERERKKQESEQKRQERERKKQERERKKQESEQKKQEREHKKQENKQRKQDCEQKKQQYKKKKQERNQKTLKEEQEKKHECKNSVTVTVQEVKELKWKKQECEQKGEEQQFDETECGQIMKKEALDETTQKDKENAVVEQQGLEQTEQDEEESSKQEQTQHENQQKRERCLTQNIAECVKKDDKGVRKKRLIVSTHNQECRDPDEGGHEEEPIQAHVAEMPEEEEADGFEKAEYISIECEDKKSELHNSQDNSVSHEMVPKKEKPKSNGLSQNVLNEGIALGVHKDEETCRKKTGFVKPVKRAANGNIPEKPAKRRKNNSKPKTCSNGPVWVQCDECTKWRILKDCNDPCLVPVNWSCKMNSDPLCNSCSVSEGDWPDLSNSQEYIYSQYKEGSIVWAKLQGYPWWPGMIEDDPDMDTCMAWNEDDPPEDTPPAEYHIVYFGRPVSRAWVPSTMVHVFDEDASPPEKENTRTYAKSLAMAIKEAKEASNATLEERLKKYSFNSRFGKSMRKRKPGKKVNLDTERDEGILAKRTCHENGSDTE